ncbi:protein Wnt-11b-2-like [Tubulanus polymorphus]|uniref:protein Wnt-11b-2-like n=1 Tax=Tubulanus polymorphus TaxID=672921 RepID=UPI003DA5E2C2
MVYCRIIAATLVLFNLFCQEVDSIKWLALAKSRQRHWNQTVHCIRSRADGLVAGQVRICKKNLDIMHAVHEASAQTHIQCMRLFADRRWNCSSIQQAPNYTPDLTTGTREQAFVYALSSASITQSIARACSSGRTSRCSCGPLPREPPDGDFKWGGCGDDLRYGIYLSRTFTDAPYIYRKKSKKAPAAGVDIATQAPPVSKKSKMKAVRKFKRSTKAQVNRHNSEAGRQAVEQSMRKSCKCHGVSGSCSLKTCWKALPDVAQIGQILKNRYHIAVEVVKRKVEKRKRLVPIDPDKMFFRVDEMIYYSKSPDYCSPDKKLGSVGTRGRFCKQNSPGSASCDSMCCGRGYLSYTEEVKERCHCKYYWCCYVKCKTCVKQVERNMCR